MKKFSIILFSLLLPGFANAQLIRINGEVKTRNELPVADVAILAFYGGELLRSCISDEKGEFSFYVKQSSFEVLLYKPGMKAFHYGVMNKLDRETQGIFIGITMDDTLGEHAADLPRFLHFQHLSQMQLDSIYTDRLNKKPPPTAASIKRAEKLLVKAARAEQKRFANFRENTTSRSVNDHPTKVTTIRLGEDIYEMIVDEKGDRRYNKNHKPITLTTYEFETTRRYENVLNEVKSVKRFEKYKPMEHVKTGPVRKD